MSSNSWNDLYDEGYFSRTDRESFSQVPIDHELSQLFQRLRREILRFPIMSIEPELTEFYPLLRRESPRFPDVNLSRAEIEALFRDRVEFCLGDGDGVGVIVARFKGESSDE